MTAYFIDSANSITQTTADTDGLDLNGGDTLVVAAGGSIAALGGGQAVNDSAGSALITIDGLVYADEAAAIFVNSAATDVTVDGTAQGNQGVELFNADDVVDVGKQGEVDGFSGAATLPGVGVLIHTATIEGPLRLGVKTDDSSNTAEDDTVNNDGDIIGSIAGVELDSSSGGNTINNSGSISGVTGILATEEQGADSIVNLGTISGSTTGVLYTDCTRGLNLVNSGAIAGQVAIAFNNSIGLIDTIDNSGNISSSGEDTIVVDKDRLDVNNSGTIHGGIVASAGGTVDIENEGHWIRSQFAPLFSLAAAGDIIENSGLLQGAIGVDSGADTLNNSGSILGYITFAGSGTGDALTNSGGITGNVAMSANSEILTNAGAIVGSVDLSGTKNVITNRGEISDSVTLGAHSTLTNTGVISGNLTLGASDAAYLGKGDVAGKIDALAGGDTLEFAAGFGHETIEFAPATTASVTHDVFEFQTDAFADYTLVQKAMTQVGANVIIRLDADDTLLIDKTTVSSLVAADFKFL